MGIPAVTFTEQNTCPIVQEGSLTAYVTGARYPLTYLWSNGQTTSSINNLPPGTYSVTITDRYGRVIKAVDSVKVLNDSSCLILVKFTEQGTCPMAKNGSLTATETGGRNPVKYLWTTGDTTNTISNLAPGNYNITVTDKYGRQVTATGTVEGYTQDLSCLNIPSAFTPDGDGVNDVWKIRSLSEYTTCKVDIFNQWGSLVFKSTGYNTPWDGRYNGEAVPAGAYYYTIDLNNNSNKFTGTVTIIK
jgi:gliding motility-associated-like protein